MNLLPFQRVAFQLHLCFLAWGPEALRCFSPFLRASTWAPPSAGAPALPLDNASLQPVPPPPRKCFRHFLSRPCCFQAAAERRFVLSDTVFFSPPAPSAELTQPLLPRQSSGWQRLFPNKQTKLSVASPWSPLGIAGKWVPPDRESAGTVRPGPQCGKQNQGFQPRFFLI